MKKKIVVVALISGVLGSSYAQDRDNYGTMNRERHGVSGRFSSDDGGRAFSQFRTVQQEPSAVQLREYQQSVPQYREPQYRNASKSPEYREPQYRNFSQSSAYQSSAYQEPSYQEQASVPQYREQPTPQYREQSASQYREQPTPQYREQPVPQYREQPTPQYRDSAVSQYRDQTPERHNAYRQGFDEGNFVMNDQTGEKVVLDQNDPYAVTPQSRRTNRFATSDSEWNQTSPQTASSVLPHEDRRLSRSASFDDNFDSGTETRQVIEEQPLHYESQRQAMPQRRENLHNNQSSYRKKPLIGNPFKAITRTFGRLFGR